MMSSERLQKLMARAGLGSRRENEALISAGRVRVNGNVSQLGDKADPQRDRIEVDGHPLVFERRIYIKLNKPKGVLSSTVDDLGKGRPTVLDIVRSPGHLYPVGRLDKQSEGLILLTNDGPLTHRLTHPRYRHCKVYRVAVEGRMPNASIRLWRRGVILDGRLTAPAKITVLSRESNRTMLRISMTEGRKRQIRRIAASLGHPVTMLLREQLGPITLGSLGVGEWRYLAADEVAALRAAAFGTAKSEEGK